MKMPKESGPFHLMGIGGIGMSALARILIREGYEVQGTDLSETAQLQHLRAEGIRVSVGHASQNLEGARVVVVSSAIREENPELQAAYALGLPVVRRADILAEVMRERQTICVAGTHGKTTTTTLLAGLLEAGGHDPIVVNGGIMNAYGANIRWGKGNWMVVEADESDGSFLCLPRQNALVTNINPEHLDHYGCFEALRKAFLDFIMGIPFYGSAVLCLDDPDLRGLIGSIRGRHVITYGADSAADVRYYPFPPREGEETLVFSLEIRGTSRRPPHRFERLSLPALGFHNMCNACGAVAMALQLGLSEEEVRAGLAAFQGVQRRLTHVGMWKGMLFFDDYAHHPTEIRAVLEAVRPLVRGRLYAVVQPHRYSRLHALFEEFCQCFEAADTVLVAPIYAAGESPLADVSHEKLTLGLSLEGGKKAFSVSSSEEIAQFFLERGEVGDVGVFLGAGNITQWARSLQAQLELLDSARVETQLERSL